MKWYDKKGKLLTTAKVGSKKWGEEMQEVERLLRNFKYKIVKQEKLWWGGFLSTVWLGLDHSFIETRKPLIFETMLFYKDVSDLDMNRYSSLKEAREGHENMKKTWNNPIKILKGIITHYHH